jgi:hypothetical protein
MHPRAIAATLAAAAILGTGAAVKADPPNFDFFGYATIPAAVNGTLVLRSVLTNNGVVPTPIPLAFATHQYTLVVTARLAAEAGVQQQYDSGTVEIWEDPVAGGTAANHTAPGTFTDGTLILAGSFDGVLARTSFPTTPPGSVGSFLGQVDFAGGTRLGDLAGTQDWPFGGGWSRRVSGIPGGYDEGWDGKIDLGPVAVEPRAWDGVKRLYR